jgi:hypothetical protein
MHCNIHGNGLYRFVSVLVDGQGHQQGRIFRPTFIVGLAIGPAGWKKADTNTAWNNTKTNFYYFISAYYGINAIFVMTNGLAWQPSLICGLYVHSMYCISTMEVGHETSGCAVQRRMRTLFILRSSISNAAMTNGGDGRSIVSASPAPPGDMLQAGGRGARSRL